MFQDQTIFAQILDLIPYEHFKHLVRKFDSNKGNITFSAYSHLVCMLYAQLSRRRSLRDLVACLNSQQSKLYHIGIRAPVSRSTLAYANEHRDHRLFEALAQRLISIALEQHQQADFPLGLKEPLYAMDATTIDLCLTLFPWAKFRRTKAGIKLHTILDLRGAIPIYINITPANIHEVSMLDNIILPMFSTVVFDRGYIAFTKLFLLTIQHIHFVIRAKNNLQYRVITSRPVDKASGLRADQTITLKTTKARIDYPKPLRRVSYYDTEQQRRLIFLTDRFDLPAQTIASIYKSRWQVELFFKWMKQNLTVEHFFGNTENAVKTQIWTAICAYVLMVLVHRRLSGQVSLRILMNILEINLFERSLIEAVVRASSEKVEEMQESNQLNLFD